MVSESVLELKVGQSREGANTNDELVSLFLRLSEGDIQVLEIVYDLCARQIFGLALWRTGSSEDAADVVQEVFVRLAARQNRLPPYANPALPTTTHRVACDLMRRKKRVVTHVPLVEQAFVESAGTDHPSPVTIPPRTSRSKEALYLRY
jgi:DNA-directed RNA polymerase specialized sigma24 family protein